MLGGSAAYYPLELYRRLRHYVERRIAGYTDRGSLEAAAEQILTERAEGRFRAGSQFRGEWPRDLCFSARGLVAAGFADELRAAAEFMLEEIADTFYTDFHDGFNAAVPEEGIDTFPALVIILDETGEVEEHADDLAALADLHRRKFFDESADVVGASGSSWWDSTSTPREAYNTAMLLTAVERLEGADVPTVYTGHSGEIRDGMTDELWNGAFFDEYRESSVLACDANVVPLYFGIVDRETAERIVASLARLETENGLKMREKPFAVDEVHPFFLLHRDYHYPVWPWNGFMYANGLKRYGFDDRAEREVERLERLLEPYGNFLEVLDVDGDAYVKRGYASAEDFTVAAALWTEYHRAADRSIPGDRA